MEGKELGIGYHCDAHCCVIGGVVILRYAKYACIKTFDFGRARGVFHVWDGDQRSGVTTLFGGGVGVHDVSAWIGYRRKQVISFFFEIGRFTKPNERNGITLVVWIVLIDSISPLKVIVINGNRSTNSLFGLAIADLAGVSSVL